MASTSSFSLRKPSVAGIKVFSPGGTVCSGTKFAVRAISEGLRHEVGGQNRNVSKAKVGVLRVSTRRTWYNSIRHGGVPGQGRITQARRK
jgi:NADP-dependent 3-hydroxy acid dehydrogenase YdfG